LYENVPSPVEIILQWIMMEMECGKVALNALSYDSLGTRFPCKLIKQNRFHPFMKREEAFKVSDFVVELAFKISNGVFLIFLLIDLFFQFSVAKRFLVFVQLAFSLESSRSNVS
jgi:hypothetical protein